MTPPGPVTPDSGDELLVQIIDTAAKPTEPIVTIAMDGQVILGDGYTVDEAARAFWDAIAEHAAQMTEQARAEERARIADDVHAFADAEYSGAADMAVQERTARLIARRIARGETP